MLPASQISLTSNPKKPGIKEIIWLILFSIAMGYMESAVVIYLRKIYYPEGFKFPLVPLDAQTGLVEIFREAATIIMLAGIAILTGKTSSLRFAYFIFCFAVWDLCYYFFLWIFLGWPESLFTSDILFLIPVPWVGPVLAPCIVSVTMLILASSIIYFQRKGLCSGIQMKERILLLIGGAIIILSMMWDYLQYIKENKSGTGSLDLSDNQNMLSELKNFVPAGYNWILFLSGEAMLLLGIISFIERERKRRKMEM